MLHTRRGQYQMQNQNLFRYAPITKAWLLITLFSSVICMHFDIDDFDSWIAPSLENIISVKGMLQLISSKLVFRTPSLLISGLILLYYGRLVERRFGSCKFINFILFNSLHASAVEIAIYFVLSRFYGYIPSTMHFIVGPYDLLTALYLTYVKEIPLVPYASILGLSLSAHSFPFIMFIQLLALSKPVLIACTAGASSVLLYPQLFTKINFLPNFFIQLFRSTSNPIGWLLQKFAECGEFGSEGSVLPIAATVERQRIDILDNYERRLMFGQMQRVYRNERARPSDSQLHFLNRLLGRASTGSARSNEDQVRQLVDMGLGSREDVREALQQCGNDASEAANLLLHNRR
ncbi:UBA/TS-N domain-containing protein [Loa loa]|uniref:UBA/TS-N domain-containing protein n=1 Tax=Loa loa TaxID=7209 RepID=A0A1I7VNQ0_LOALO|nr:UBA/TS-N domain-containing protein [Loa loa]EFO26063.2 UBA/TS-N domain-containing protein [Loa loa]